LEYRCGIHDRIIFDCGELILPGEKEIILSDSDLTPMPAENNNLTLCKVKFNVISTIFPSANPQDVIQGWNHLSQYLRLDEALRLDRMTEIFIGEYVTKLTGSSPSIFCLIEPDIIDCARMSYWYYICLKNDNNNTFQYKRKEIKGKLRYGLLSNLEKFKISYSYKNNEEIVTQFEQTPDGERVKKLQALPKIKTALPLNEETRKQYKDSIYQWFKDVSSINAELMFAGICHTTGHEISFEPPHDKLHDYDFLINGIPAQVKANIIYRGNTDRVNEYLYGIQSVMNMSRDGVLTKEYVQSETRNFIKRDYLNQIRKAIEQKARVVFIDGTQSSVGFALNKLASESRTNFNIKNSLSDALALYATDSNFIPSIFAVGAYDYDYRLSSICMRIPIIKTEHRLILDESKLDLISVIN
jgi:hypothetical protein